MPTLPVDHGCAGRPLDGLDDVGLLARAAPVQAAGRAAEAAQVDHHERVAALHQLRALDEVVEAVRRARSTGRPGRRRCPGRGRPGRSGRSG